MKEIIQKCETCGTTWKSRKYLAYNTKDGSVHIVIAKGYWAAFKKAQKWFGSQTGIKVVQDNLSTT